MDQEQYVYVRTFLLTSKSTLTQTIEDVKRKSVIIAIHLHKQLLVCEETLKMMEGLYPQFHANYDIIMKKRANLR